MATQTEPRVKFGEIYESLLALEGQIIDTLKMLGQWNEQHPQETFFGPADEIANYGKGVANIIDGRMVRDVRRRHSRAAALRESATS